MNNLEDELRSALEAVSALESAFYRADHQVAANELLRAEGTLSRLLIDHLDGDYDDVDL